jgi:protease I
MRPIIFIIGLCTIIASCSASNYWIEHQNRLLRELGVGTTVLTAYNSTFSAVASLDQEDNRGLRGMTYKDEQPPVDNPSSLVGKRIGFVASHCFEEVELTFPWIYFASRGATVEIITPWWVPGYIVACEFVRATTWAKSDRNFKDALVVQYDALVVPGGVWSSTVVRNDEDAIRLIRHQFNSGRLVATVCSGSTVLIDAQLARGTTLTGSPAIKQDLINSGAIYLDQPVVQNGTNLLTGRSPQNDDNLLFTLAIDKYLTAL